MKTAVTYSVVARKNPKEPEFPPKFYAHAQARGEADIKTLSDRIQVMCTVTRADVMAVLVALETTVNDCLANGEIVRLGDLGSLQMSLSSDGAVSKEDFTPSMIKKSRILFRPGETLAAMQKTLRYERVEQHPKKGATVPEDPGTKGPEEPGGSGVQTEDGGLGA